jgi:hypothetical protein
MGDFNLRLSLGPTVTGVIPRKDRPPRSETTTALQSLQRSNYGTEQKTSLSLPERSKFINDNKDLIYVIERSEEAQNLLVKRSVQNRDDLKKIIGESAHSLLQGESKTLLNQDLLKEQTELASFILLNQGGLRDKINNNKKIASLFTRSEGVQAETEAEVAHMAANLFDEGQLLHDIQFFKTNINAAVYLLTDPSSVKRLQDEGEAQTFKSQIADSSWQDTFDRRVLDRAVESTRSGTFDRDFFTENQSLTTFVAASSFTTKVPSASDILKENLQWAQGNPATRDQFNMGDFLKVLSNRRMQHETNSVFGSSDQSASTHLGITRLASQDIDFKKSFNTQETKSLIEALAGVGTQPPSSKIIDLISSRLKGDDSSSFLSLTV